jgi:beta-lactam-binding protein with PASTA domain
VTTVPQVIGMEAEAACLRVLAADLTPYGAPDHSPAPEAGIIVRQTLAPGAQTAAGGPVILETDTGGRGAEPGRPDPAGSDELTPA